MHKRLDPRQKIALAFSVACIAAGKGVNTDTIAYGFRLANMFLEHCKDEEKVRKVAKRREES
jgi:hypothetical protein